MKIVCQKILYFLENIGIISISKGNATDIDNLHHMRKIV